MKRLLIALAALLACAPAYAQQKPTDQIKSDISTLLPTTGTGSITAAQLRQVANEIADSYANKTGDTFIGAVSIPFTQSGTGALASTLDAWAKGRAVAITDFCSSSQMSSDATSCLQSAITQACSRTSPTILINASATFTGTLNVACTGLTFDGGSRQSLMTFANSSLDDFTISGVGQITFRNLYLNHSGKTGGQTFYISGSNQILIDNIVVDHPWRYATIENTNTVEFRGVNLNDAKGEYGVRIHASTDGSQRTDVVTFWNSVIQMLYNGGDGLQIDGNVNTVRWYGGSILGAKYAVLVQNSASSASYFPNALFFTGLETDGEKSGSILIQCAQNVHFIGGDLSNTSTAPSTATPQAGADGATLQINNGAGGCLSDNIHIIGTRISNSRVQAAFIDANHVEIIGAGFHDSSKAGDNSSPMVQIGPNARNLTWTGGQAGAVLGNSVRTTYGVQIDAGASNVRITGVDLSGNHAPLLNNAGSGALIFGSGDASSNLVNSSQVTAPSGNLNLYAASGATTVIGNAGGGGILYVDSGSAKPALDNSFTSGAAGQRWSSVYATQYYAGAAVAGVSCSGAPTASYAVVNGIVTHC